MQISKLLDRVESNAIVLPEFQREFVWKRSQARELMNSLYRGYPIGGFLTWETETPPEIKNDAIDEEKQALFEVLLDGQQRLTVLYMLLKDAIPPYYSKEDVQSDPRKLYFNVENGEFQFENKPVRDGTTWVRVTDCFTGKISPIAVARERVDNEDTDRVMRLSEEYEKHINQLKNIPTRDIPVETLPKSADIHQAVELFDKINSQGTHLSDAELALAHMSIDWPHIRRKMKIKQNGLSERGFEFNLNFYVKCMVGVLTGTMTYEQVYDIPGHELKERWYALADNDGVFDYTINVLKNEAYIASSDYINTRDALIPFIVYLERNDREISQEEKRQFLQWLYAAMMWGRYSGSSDTTVERDLSLLDNDSPTDDLIGEIEDDRGRIEVQASDLEGRGKRTRRFYNMVRIIVRANNPVDWRTGEPLVGSYELESHHIFPKNKLYDKYDSGESLHRKIVNEIANRAFLTPETNKKIGDRLPEEYLPETVANHPSALSSQFILENEELWKIENYEGFLAKRRDLLADAINDYMEDLVIGSVSRNEETIEDLINAGETPRIEFKETLLYDVYQDQPNKNLRSKVAKEVAAMANAHGGVVIIGVEDEDKKVRGLDRDYSLIGSRDEFGLQLDREIANRLGRMMAVTYTTVEFETVDDKDLCVIRVDRSPEPVFFDNGSGEEFYVRMGTSAEPMGMQEANDYIQTNFS
ncbi:MAG: DUF262 domain-containing protein [Halalkalicoccus sp.]